jgi:hypothetical protein
VSIVVIGGGSGIGVVIDGINLHSRTTTLIGAGGITVIAGAMTGVFLIVGPP